MVYQERFLSRSVQHAVLRAALYGGRLHALRRWLWNNGYIKLRHRHQGVPQRRWRWIPDQPQLRTVSAPPSPRPHSLPHSLPYSFPHSFRLLIHTDSSSPTAGMSPIVSPSGFATRSASRAWIDCSADCGFRVRAISDLPRLQIALAQASADPPPHQERYVVLAGSQLGTLRIARPDSAAWIASRSCGAVPSVEALRFLIARSLAPPQYKSARIAMQVAHPADQPRTKYRAAKAGRWLCASDSFVPARRTDGSAEHQLASRSSAQAPDSQQDLRPLAMDTT